MIFLLGRCITSKACKLSLITPSLSFKLRFLRYFPSCFEVLLICSPFCFVCLSLSLLFSISLTLHTCQPTAYTKNASPFIIHNSIIAHNCHFKSHCQSQNVNQCVDAVTLAFCVRSYDANEHQEEEEEEVRTKWKLPPACHIVIDVVLWVVFIFMLFASILFPFCFFFRCLI